MRLKSLLIVCVLCVKYMVYAQDGSVVVTPIWDEAYVSQNFCGALTNLLADAGNKFGKAKGKEIETHSDVIIWSSNTGLPGAITTSLLFTTSWHFEGVVYLGTSEMEMGAAYSKYKKLLDACLPDKGYFVSNNGNTDPKLQSYPVAMYTIPAEGGKPLSPHVSLEVAQAEQTNTYILSVNVWE